MSGNGSERLDYHGGRRLTVPGVGLVEIIPPQSVLEVEEGVYHVRTLEPLSPVQEEKLAEWLRVEWPQRREGFGGHG